jgi:aspartyl protease family protein
MAQDPAKKMGQGMLFVSLVLALVLMTWFFGRLEERQHNPNQLPVSTSAPHSVEVILERNRAGHYVTSGTINGHAVEFLLDTGATEVVVPIKLANDLGLQSGYKSQAMTANGPIIVFSTEINQLSIGQINLTDIRASINPEMHAGSILLGMSALKQIEFIQRGNQLTLRQYF